MLSPGPTHFYERKTAAEYPIPEIGEQHRVLVLLLAFCGLRWGEAAPV
jgi:hypothetical protein